VTAATPISIALLAYDAVQTLDLTGPLDAFGSANELLGNAYAVTVASLDGAAVVSSSGLRILPDAALGDVGPVDTLIIPGGEGLRRTGVGAAVAAAVLRRAPATRRIVSICTGIYGLAPTGLLDGRRATTHRRFAADVAQRFAAIRLEPDALFIKDGPLYTSAGITAAIDLALALIEEDYGAAAALRVARDLVVYLKRSGGQAQYSEPLRFQSRAGDRFADLATWIAAHLGADLSVDALAGRVGLGPRQFTRRFGQVFRDSPAQLVETLRLDTARARLTATGATIDAIAASVGFASSDAFRRAFERRFGLAPSEYRARFTTAPLSPRGPAHDPLDRSTVDGTAAAAADGSDRGSRRAALHRRRRPDHARRL
jgi:transcriptional regulator GlxA family with amidase domain